MNLLEVDRVSKSFANHQALNDVSLNVEEGKVFGLLGPNGAGKTTLIRIINQITAPDQGEVRFKGRPLSPNDIHSIGYLPEERGLYKKMAVGEQAIYLARLKGLSRREALTRLKYWFEKFDIYAWWDKKVMELSKGMQQKVQFICTVLHEPELLIFDEPFSGFDPINANMIKREILELKDKGTSIIFSTHQMASVEELCDHIALVDRSRKILDGETNEVKRRFRTFEYNLQLEGNRMAIEADLKARYEIMNHSEDANLQTFRVRTSPEDNQNELLKTAMQSAEIHAYNEIIPSMNEIFIKAVENNVIEHHNG